MPVDPTYLGLIQDVTGNTVSVSLDESTISGLAFIDGQGYRIGQVGSFVRISLGYVNLFGVVSQVGAGAVPERLAAQEPHGYRWMTVQLIGEGMAPNGFRRGISQYPTVGDRVFMVTTEDLRSIYGRETAPNFVKVGHLASAESIPALVDVNRLLSRHAAVVGATGAGKSTTVATLLRALCDPIRYQSARILIVDIHGEYGSALRDLASVFRISPAADKGQENLFVYAENSAVRLVQKTVRPEGKNIQIDLTDTPSFAALALMCCSTGEVLDERTFRANATWRDPGVFVEVPEDEIEQMLLTGESETLEFKERLEKGVTDKIAKTATAFANTKGGTIVFGVDNDHRIVGCASRAMQQSPSAVVVPARPFGR